MIHSGWGSGSGYDFSEFGSGFKSYPTYLKIIKCSIRSIKMKNTPTICQFSISHWENKHYTVLQSRIHRPEIRNKIFIFICFFILAGSWSKTNNSGSGSGEKFRIRPDPDSQNTGCIIQYPCPNSAQQIFFKSTYLQYTAEYVCKTVYIYITVFRVHFKKIPFDYKTLIS